MFRFSLGVFEVQSDLFKLLKGCHWLHFHHELKGHFDRPGVQDKGEVLEPVLWLQWGSAPRCSGFNPFLVSANGYSKLILNPYLSALPSLTSG